MATPLPVLDVPVTRYGDLTDQTSQPGALVEGANTQPVRFRDQLLRADKAYFGCAHRTCPPEETLERVRPHLRTCGITRIADITGLDRVHHVPVVLAMRPNSLTLANAAGKGVTTAAATVSAVMEGIELHHAEQLALPSWNASFNQVASQRPHIAREHVPLTRYSFFHPDLPLSWVDAFDLVGQCEVAVPVDLVGMRRPHHQLRLLSSMQIGSNGLASGNHLLEAICHGLYEVIERDAIAVASLAHRDLPQPHDRRIDANTVTNRRVRQLLDDLSDRDIAVTLCDITSDLQVPTYLATTIDTTCRGQGRSKGYGCHLDPEIAMIRAITEAVQGRTVAIAGSRDDMTHAAYASMRRGDDEQAFGRFRAASASRPVLSGAESPSTATRSFEGDLAVLIDRVRGAGLHQVLVADLTDPVMGIAVARVIVPGLEGYLFPTYVPGARARAVLRGRPRPCEEQVARKAGPS